MSIASNFHGNPVNSCWNICLKTTKVVVLQFDAADVLIRTELQTDNQSEQRNVTSTATVSDALVWNGDSLL